MLDLIVASTRQRIAPLVAETAGLRAKALAAPEPLGFASGFAGDRLGVIAEIKRRSPSRGDLNRAVDPAAHATRYHLGGAAAISVLTEPEFFAGSNDDLRAVKSAVPIPVLRKDFTLHPSQIWESRIIGADAILLIVAILTDDELKDLANTAAEAGLAALVEVHTVQEAERALVIGPVIVGVNNRNLTTFEVSLETAETIIPGLTGVPVVIAESGIFRSEDALRMSAAGCDGLLVGERLVTDPDPASVIESLKVPKVRA